MANVLVTALINLVYKIIIGLSSFITVNYRLRKIFIYYIICKLWNINLVNALHYKKKDTGDVLIKTLAKIIYCIYDGYGIELINKDIEDAYDNNYNYISEEYCIKVQKHSCKDIDIEHYKNVIYYNDYINCNMGLFKNIAITKGITATLDTCNYTDEHCINKIGKLLVNGIEYGSEALLIIMLGIAPVTCALFQLKMVNTTSNIGFLLVSRSFSTFSTSSSKG